MRDGLKPVQRRILYTMWQQASLRRRQAPQVRHGRRRRDGQLPPARRRSIYDALVRMAQPFAMRAPLVDGSGNFGSLDGDPAAAMRYTECRLTPLAAELLTEIDQGTVHFRPNYDGTQAASRSSCRGKLPNLLVNGATGIAVGMATNIPPHNPEEVCSARSACSTRCSRASSSRRASSAAPSRARTSRPAGRSSRPPRRSKQIYETGQGTIKVRGDVGARTTAARRRKIVYITSIPYAVNKAELVERIADVVVARKMPLLLDVKDVSHRRRPHRAAS